MGGTNSSESPPYYSTPLPPSPPIETMITVTIIDIDGRQQNKNINLEWSFSLWAKSLFKEYAATEENLVLEFNKRRITYNEHKSQKLKTFGFGSETKIYISHEQKSCPLITILVTDIDNRPTISVRINPDSTYKQFCEELERKHGIYKINSGARDLLVQSQYIGYSDSKDKTLRELGIKDRDSATILPHTNGGQYNLKVGSVENFN